MVGQFALLSSIDCEGLLQRNVGKLPEEIWIPEIREKSSEPVKHHIQRSRTAYGARDTCDNSNTYFYKGKRKKGREKRNKKKTEQNLFILVYLTMLSIAQTLKRRMMGWLMNNKFSAEETGHTLI